MDMTFATLRKVASAAAAASPLAAPADLEHAKAIATFDDEVFALALLPDIRECTDSAAYRREAMACLAKAPAMIKDLRRESESLARSKPGPWGVEASVGPHFLALRDAAHTAEAARRLQRVLGRARREAADQALAAVDKGCQLQHWNHPTGSHTLHYVQRRESARAGGSSDRVGPPAHLDLLTDYIAAAAAARVAGNDLFRKQKYPEVWPGIKPSGRWLHVSPTG
jgi:hypothetical protein